jgi:DNA polymerase-3 subunit alpha
VAARKHTDKDPQKDKQRYHLILLAMNHKGYQNLMQLSTTANLDGFITIRVSTTTCSRSTTKVSSRSAPVWVVKSATGCKTASMTSPRSSQWYKSVFGDRYYLEIQDHGHPKNELYSAEQGAINEQVLKLGKELDIPVVLTCDAHYLKARRPGCPRNPAVCRYGFVPER